MKYAVLLLESFTGAASLNNVNLTLRYVKAKKNQIPHFPQKNKSPPWKEHENGIFSLCFGTAPLYAIEL